MTVPHLPCAEVCREFNFYCGETLESAGRELQDCTVFRDGPLVIPVSEEFSAETPCVYPDTEVVCTFCDA